MTTDAAATSLLPCPFCGNAKSIAVANEKHDLSGGYFIACPSCYASTGLRYACGEDPRPLLVEQWNRRAQPAPPAVVEPLTPHQIWANDELMSVNPLPMDELVKIVRAVERAHGIGIKKGDGNAS